MAGPYHHPWLLSDSPSVCHRGGQALTGYTVSASLWWSSDCCGCASLTLCPGQAEGLTHGRAPQQEFSSSGMSTTLPRPGMVLGRVCVVEVPLCPIIIWKSVRCIELHVPASPEAVLQEVVDRVATSRQAGWCGGVRPPTTTQWSV